MCNSGSRLFCLYLLKCYINDNTESSSSKLMSVHVVCLRLILNYIRSVIVECGCCCCCYGYGVFIYFLCIFVTTQQRVKVKIADSFVIHIHININI